MNKPNISRQDATLMLSAAYPGLFNCPVVVFGLRGFFDDPGANKRGVYDDVIGLVTPDTFLALNGNTDPSVDRKGIAVLQDGVYDYVQGLHGISHLDRSRAADEAIYQTLMKTGRDHPPVEGRSTPLPYWAFRQAGPVLLKRDGDSEAKPDGWPNAPAWIDIHRGGYNTTSSLGCQTVHPDYWKVFFWDVALPSMQKYNCPRVKYALLTKK
jgi:hypothetical protein